MEICSLNRPIPTKRRPRRCLHGARLVLKPTLQLETRHWVQHSQYRVEGTLMMTLCFRHILRYLKYEHILDIATTVFIVCVGHTQHPTN